MMSLLLKEFDGLRPYWYGVAAMCIWFAASHLLEPLGLYSLSEVSTDGVDAWGFVSALLCFALGHSLPSREYRQGHIEFLDGLPVRRWAVYLAKVTAAVLPLLVLVVGTGLVKWFACTLVGAPEGLSVLPAIGAQMMRFAAMCFGFLGAGLLLSWIGGLGWGVMLVLGFLLMTLSIPIHALRPYSFFDGMLVLDWQGSEPVPQWGPVVFWTALGALSTLLSGLLFLGPGRVLMSQRTWTGGAVRWVAIGCGSFVFLALSGLATLGLAVQHGGRLLTATTTQQTQYFTFLYPVNDAVASQAVIDKADAINEDLAAEIGSDGPVYLDVELLGASSAHAGVFLGGKIRMGLSGTGKDGPLDVLTHELAHAHAYALMGGEMTRHFDKTRFFQEGFARYYENRLPGLEVDRKWASAVHATGQSRFDLLVEDATRRATHDPDQAYPLGEVFVQALVHEYGDGAPACVQRKLGQVGHRDVAGMSLWYELMNGCDYELDRVVSRYDSMLSTAADELPELPDLTGRVENRKGRQLLYVHDDNNVGGRIVCRFRDRVEDSRNQYTQTNVLANGACRVGAEVISGRTFQYQLGFYVEGEEFPVFLEWTTAPLL